MVKLVVKICAFFIILGVLISLMDNCQGNSFDKLLDDMFFSSSKETKDSDDVTFDDVEDADPDQFNIYANIILSQISNQYVSCNTTNISISQEIIPINNQIVNINQSISNQNNYISKSSINQNTLINWTTDNRTNISQLNSQYQRLNENIETLKSDIEKLKREFKSLKKAIEKNETHFEKYIRELSIKYKKEVLEAETAKYEAIKREIVKRLNRLSDKISSLEKEIESNSEKLKELDISIKKIIRQLTEINKKLDELIEKSGNIEQATVDNDVNYYFIIDTEEVLKSKGIISSTGLFGSLTINPNLDKDNFGILTKQNKTIPLGGKEDKFDIISEMPDDSYEFRIINDVKVLIIKDVNKFWSISEYLVIIKESI